MGKLSRPNALKRQNTLRRFPPLSSTSGSPKIRPLTKAEKETLAEMHGQVLIDKDSPVTPTPVNSAA